MPQIGLMIEGQDGLTWARWQRLLQAVQDFGFQCVFRSDHYTIGPPDNESLETFVSLTYAASHTKNIEFGSLVAPTTFRHPALTARMAAAIDDLSGGRMVLGLGAGWHEREHIQFGVPFYDKTIRFEMFEDALEITSRLFKSDVPVSYTGKHFSLNEAILLARPQRVGGPRILIGGNGPLKTLPLVARFADEWNAVSLAVSAIKERNALLDSLLIKNGRKPSDVKRSYMTTVIFGQTDAELQSKLARTTIKEQTDADPVQIIGTPSAVIDRLGKFVEAGVERFMLRWADFDDIAGLEALAKVVLPHFHKS